MPFFLYNQNEGKKPQIQSGTFMKANENGYPNHISFRRIWGSDAPGQLCLFGIKHAEYKKQAVFGEFEGPSTAQRSSETNVFNIEHRIFSGLFLRSA